MKELRRRLQQPEGKARKALERMSTSLILVALGTVPLEASPEMKEGWQLAITWIELGILGLFTAEYVLRLWIAERPWKYVFSIYGLIDLAAILPFNPEPRTVHVAGNVFVFTGTGVFGMRKMMQDATVRANGIVERNVTKRTNFLVLGTYVTPAWIHQSFGRKIEKAMEYRASGIGLRIVHEEDWMRAIER